MLPPPYNSQTNGDVTRLLHAAASGDRAALEHLLPIVYGQLRAIARQRMTRERDDHTLQATALVHEAYVQLLGGEASAIQWNDRLHFFRAAAEAMRRILIDHARTRTRQKRGGSAGRVSLDGIDVGEPTDESSEDILALDAAICRLQERDPRAAEVVRLRYFGGLGVEDTAAALGLSPRTVKREWNFARAWLFEQLRSD